MREPRERLVRVGRRKAVAALVLALGASAAFPVRAQQSRRAANLSVGAREGSGFEWLPTECADERYPMQLIRGELHCPGSRIVEVPAGKIVNNGWGEIGSRRLVGPAIKPVPERLALTWFSYAEDQFFGGVVELPHRALTDLFRAGFREPDTGQGATWSKIIVGMGLGGWCSVWVAGGSLVREVVRAQVAPTSADWSRVIDNPAIPRSDYVRSKLQSRLGDAAFARLAKDGPPVSAWTRYSQRYRWRMLPGGQHAPQSALVRTFNGERSFHELAGQSPPDLEVAPKQLQIIWRSRNSGRLLTSIRLDEEEVFVAFGKASAASRTNLRVEFATHKDLALTVEGGAVRLPLIRSSVELRSLS